MHRLQIPLIAAALIAAVSCSRTDSGTVEIIPYPNHVAVHSGSFTVAGAEFRCSPEIGTKERKVISEFAERLSAVSGIKCEVTEGDKGDGLVFTVDSSLPEEAYEIRAGHSRTVIKASSYNGFLYAIETIRQMLPVEIYATDPAPDKDWSIPCVTIKDAPRFAYRGQHLDVSRHFFSIDEVKKVLDMMAIHKMNVLHWHLTDDQGWRVEIDRYPRLTSVGSIRKGTVVKKNWDQYDGIPYGGWYTKAQIKDVIAYAADKGIEIIPEIDLPGHMLAALTAYPGLGCTGGPYEVWGRWGVADDVLCAGNEETMVFLENVLAEIADLFPSDYIHIGGDECPKVRWEKCPVCQAKIKELGLQDDDRFSAEHYLQSYVMERMEKFLAGKGKKIIGWDEILEGTPGPEATIMSWRGSEGGIKASQMGHDVIMTPNSHFYFDYYQAPDPSTEPFGIGGYIPIEKVYSYEPYTDEMDGNARSHILGVQANLWTEYIADNAHLEYMLYPRQAALAEVQWCQPQTKDWERFLASLTHEVAIYDLLGYNYATTAFQIISQTRLNKDRHCVEAVLTTQGDAPIRYTLDGTEPGQESPLYTAPVEILGACTLKAKVERDNMNTTVYTQDFVDNKAIGREVTLLSQPREKYRYGAPDTFVDGIRGVFQYSSGQWAGWFGEPLEAMIDMGGEQTYSAVTLGTMVIKDEDVFPPLNVTVCTSDDGKTFTEAGRLDIPEETRANPDGLREYTVEFPGTSARYLKISAKTVEAMPSWHGRAGTPGFLFVDEIIVK